MAVYTLPQAAAPLTLAVYVVRQKPVEISIHQASCVGPLSLGARDEADVGSWGPKAWAVDG